MDIQRLRSVAQEEDQEQDGVKLSSEQGGEVVLEDAEDVYTVLARFSGSTPEMINAAIEIELRVEDVQIVWSIVPWEEISAEIRERVV